MLSAPGFAEKSPQNSYLSKIIQVALEKKTYEQRYWHLLLHYKKGFLGGITSEADGLSFFNSPNGRKDPKAELIATVESFFMPLDSLPKNQEHPQCKFPARLKWLKKELSISKDFLPNPNCSRLDLWVNQLDPNKVTLIFASYYMNNPASMFGHTFLRLDNKEKGSKKKLLNYGVNYAANPDTTNAVLYALKGLIGAFQGRFSVFPFYVKVQEYSNWESRDLWEYELNFTQEQIQYLVFHLWELGGTYFDYYYLQENCSYHILSVLEVANPDLHLTDPFLFSVLPADTIKVLKKHEGTLSKLSYRPAILSQLRNKVEKMSGKEKTILYQMVKKQDAYKSKGYQSLTTPQKALVLDSYLDVLQYKAMQIEEEDPSKPFRIPHSILLERSKLKFQRIENEVTKYSLPPDTTHGSDRAHLGVGIFDDEFFQEIGYYPTLHDLLAKDNGYNKDSQFLFFDFNLRYYSELQKFRVDRFKILDIVSLSPFDPIFKKPSWRLNLGFDTVRDFDCDFCTSFKGGASIGLTFKQKFYSPIAIFFLLEVEGETSGHFKNNFRLGGGPLTGALIDINENWRIQLTGEYKRYGGDDSEFFKFSIEQRYAISKNFDIRVSYNRIDKKDEAILAVNLFY